MTGGLWPGEKGSDAQRRPHAARLTTIDLVDAWPELAESVPSADLGLARRVLVARVIIAKDADLFELLGTTARRSHIFLVVEGVVVKVTDCAGRSALELLGPGDLLAPPLTAARQAESSALSRYTAARVACGAGRPFQARGPTLAGDL